MSLYLNLTTKFSNACVSGFHTTFNHRLYIASYILWVASYIIIIISFISLTLKDIHKYIIFGLLLFFIFIINYFCENFLRRLYTQVTTRCKQTLQKALIIMIYVFRTKRNFAIAMHVLNTYVALGCDGFIEIRIVY